MTQVKWIKIETDIFDDEKIAMIESMPNCDSIIVIWFKLLCLAGKQNNNGVFMLNDSIPYTDEMLAAIFRRPLSLVRLALSTFQGFGMVDIIEGAVTIPHWEEHQNTEALARRREQTKQRVAAMRARQKAAVLGSSSNKSLPLPSGSSTSEEHGTDGTPQDKDAHAVKDQAAASPTTFEVPTATDVREFAIANNIQHVDPQKFLNYNANRNWQIKGRPIDDWRRLMLVWESKASQKHQSSTPTNHTPTVSSVMTKYGVSKEKAVEMIDEDIY